MLYLGRSTPWYVVTRLNTLLLPVIVGAVLLSCGTGSGSEPELILQGEWNQEGLKSTRINKIIPSSDGFVLATEEGVFTGNGDRFNRAGLEDEIVVDIVLTGDDERLAGIRGSDFSGGDTTLFKTTDRGASWWPSMGNYGDEDGKHTWVAALAVHPEDPQRLFARGGANVSRSMNGGQNWESVFLSWEKLGSNASLLKIDPYNPDIIWAGGATAALQPYMVKSEDGGDSWQWLTVLENTDATVHDIVISSTDANDLLIGLAGAVDPANLIRKSTDGGQSWETVYASPGITALARSPRDPRIVYASGFNSQRTLFVLVSSDFGNTWQTIEMEDGPTDIEVNDMVAVKISGREVLYLGTNNGVYSYTFEK